MHCVHILQLLKAFIIINVTTLIIKRCLYNDWFVTCCKAVQDIRAQITPIYCNSICFQVKPFLREESGALLLIPCSLGSSESFLCVKIKLGELLLIVSLNEGTMLPEILRILQENKNLSFFSSKWKRNSKLHSACNETSRRVWSLQAAFHHHLPLLPFLFLVEFPGFPKPILFSHSTFLPCRREASLYVVLPWKHLLDTGWRWERSRARKGNSERPKSEGAGAPSGFFPFQGSLQQWTHFFLDLFVQFRTLCQKRGIQHTATEAVREKGQTLSLVISCAPSKVSAWYFPCKSAPNLLDPLPLSWCHLHSPQPFMAPSLRVVLATRDI